MAELEGSEKQVSWASDIRASVLSGIEQKRSEAAGAIEHARTKHPEYFEKAGTRDMLDRYARLISDLTEAKSLLENEGSAKWWIDNGRSGLGYVVMAALKRDLAMAV